MTHDAALERAFHNQQDMEEQGGDEVEMLQAVARWLDADDHFERESTPRHERAARTFASIKHRLYKDTECGAWIELHTSEDHAGPGITIGTIVEGSDVEPCVMPEELSWPFTEERFELAIKNIEHDADLKWHECNDEQEPA